MKMNNIEMYFELHGEGSPLVLVSGYACDHTFWGMMTAQLAKKFQVLIFDNRATGQTKAKGGAFTIENMADDVMGLVQQTGIKCPHILGHSMGGAIAQTIAVKYPDKINKMIILNSTAKLNMRTIKALESILNLRKENVPIDFLLETSMPECVSAFETKFEMR